MLSATNSKTAKAIAALNAEIELRLRGINPGDAPKKSDKPLTYREWLPVVSPTFTWTWRQTSYIIEHIEQMLAGDIDKLMIFMPPRHTKSETVTVRLPAYILEQDPSQRCILGAYAQALASKFSRKTRRIVQSRMKLSKDRTAVDDWETEEGGGLRAVGVGAGVTGMGGNWIFIDDPVKNREEANSQTYREKCWDWYTDDLYTRLEPGGKIVLIMCMTGDTPVLMADGSERPLRDIKVGDQIGTYEDGKLSASTVINHKSNGPDLIYRIRTTCGRVVSANERHPFLVDEGGKLRWIRLKNLNTTHKIVTLKDNGGSGRVRSALSLDAENRSAHEDTVLSTTGKRCGRMGTALRRLIQNIVEICGLNSGTGSRLQNMMKCTLHKMASALSVSNHPEITCEHIGEESCASTTVTKPTRSEHCFVTTATLPSDTPRQSQPHLQSLNISDFTVAQIENIEPAGIEEVFDIQVARTENFIANGLVSHNTRWHEDDLAGRILASEDGPNWTVINLPALAEANDPLGREEGEALCPERYTEADLLRTKRVMGASFQALYQQRPAAEEGEIFKREWWQYYREAPKLKWIMQSWDTAFKKGAENDYSVCTTWGCTNTGFYLLDRWKEKVDYPTLKKTAKGMAAKWCPRTILIEDKASGQSLIQDLKTGTNLPIIAVPVDSDKNTRAHAVTPTVEAGNVYLPESAPWLQDYIDEHAVFPNGSHDDEVDSTTQFLNYVRRKGEAAFKDFAEAAEAKGKAGQHVWRQQANPNHWRCDQCGVTIVVPTGQDVQEVAESKGMAKCEPT